MTRKTIDGEVYVAVPTGYALIDGMLYVPEQGAPGTEEPVKPSGRWDAALRALEPDYSTGAWGMSDQTAKSQVNMSGGRDASKRIVEINLTRSVPTDYWSRVRKIAAEFDLSANLLCAIFCRESHHGAALDSRGEGDRGYAFGVGQVDKRYHTQRGRPDPYSEEHMRQCCEILVDYMGQVERKHGWEDKYTLKGGAVAYNSGVGNVATIDGMDLGTTGNDYGADVTARAQFYIGLMPE